MALLEELDVSARNPLQAGRRGKAGLLAAVEAIESGEADAIFVAYFDRLVRSLRVQEEVIERVEAAGGRVAAVDIGEVSYKSAAKWFSATSIGMLAEYYARSVSPVATTDFRGPGGHRAGTS